MQWHDKFPEDMSTRQCKIGSLKKTTIFAKKARISTFLGWISEMSLCFGFPDKKVAEKKNGGGGKSQKGRCNGAVNF